MSRVVFKRKIGESFYVIAENGDKIEVTLVKRDASTVTVAIDADRRYKIKRKEHLENEEQKAT